MSVFILHRYASISCDALGGCQVLFGLNGVVPVVDYF